MKRKNFSTEFKQDAIKQASQHGITKTSVAKSLGISTLTLSRWIKEQHTPLTGKVDAFVSKRDYERLYNDLERVKHERDLLKSAVTLFLSNMK